MPRSPPLQTGPAANVAIVRSWDMVKGDVPQFQALGMASNQLIAFDVFGELKVVYGQLNPIAK